MKRAYVIGLVLIVFSIFILMSVLGKSSSYVSFNEAKENPTEKYHVIGKWAKEKGMVYNPLKDPNYFEFPLRDSVGNVVNVVLLDAKPQDFERAEKVVVVGQMKGNVFEASEILTKCPSKYNAATPTVKPVNL
ncbi:MAG: cytochrome c maturation protein CcmE [Bacteroidota bacterium]|nr:cytochrome c maturation protein CcmE [Bacteroidota bacterium]